MLKLILLASSIAFAHDWGESEGLFYTEASSTFYCYADTKEGCIDEIEPLKGDCKGDAFGNREKVFKVPNRTAWHCETQEKCFPFNTYSKLVMVGAKIKNGLEKYDLMSFKHFMQIMGNKEICND